MRFFGGLDTVWMVVMFDLPTETALDRQKYTRFRKFLLKDGFSMLQFSVYGRHCPSDENADVHENRVVAGLPPKGNVRIIKVTEKTVRQNEDFLWKCTPPNRRTAASA